jgi:hypothetical protein
VQQCVLTMGPLSPCCGTVTPRQERLPNPVGKMGQTDMDRTMRCSSLRIQRAERLNSTDGKCTNQQNNLSTWFLHKDPPVFIERKSRLLKYITNME